jgi:nicotinate-nucleotide pyrophosphorylase (carboxylating)
VCASARAWLAEDLPCGAFDVGGLVVGAGAAEAVLLSKSAGVLAGVPWFDAIFAELGCSVTWLLPEGAALPASGCRVALVRGPAAALLRGERTALNALSRASGCAAAAAAAVAAARAAGWAGAVAGTRKTTPGLRALEKYALLVGGAATHRMDLGQMVMLKDNHLWAAGGIAAAVRAARAAAGFAVKIEVECAGVADACEAAAAGADVVMLDNLAPAALAAAAAAVKAVHPAVTIEGSGGITAATIGAYAAAAGAAVDVFSIGGLTHGYAVPDFSLKILRGAGLAVVAATEAAVAARAAAAGSASS